MSPQNVEANGPGPCITSILLDYTPHQGLPTLLCWVYNVLHLCCIAGFMCRREQMQGRIRSAYLGTYTNAGECNVLGRHQITLGRENVCPRRELDVKGLATTISRACGGNEKKDQRDNEEKAVCLPKSNPSRAYVEISCILSLRGTLLPTNTHCGPPDGMLAE